MTKTQNAIMQETRQQILKVIKHLSYSYKKVQNLPSKTESLTTEQLEIWESFTARFSRVSDLFLSKYLRSFVIRGDPAFSGSLRDFADQGEKMGLIDDTETWMQIRELRNTSAHEYSETGLSRIFEQLRVLAPKLLALKEQLEKHED
ncbi:MAG: nucleotidyltransferase substrate binding protein [Bdellovibrionota bacterium]